ncbi:hypothetical protein V6N12_010000 [Hibiscus sabdariffa]|uniref:Transposase n=1 Tax=Hibiscus sabdariffa TaxID=183260 RepID=A0ABR2ECD9_9ROSI
MDRIALDLKSWLYPEAQQATAALHLGVFTEQYYCTRYRENLRGRQDEKFGRKEAILFRKRLQVPTVYGIFVKSFTAWLPL